MKRYLLFDADGSHVGPDDLPDKGRPIDSLEPIVARIRQGQQALRKVAIADLIGLCDAASKAWIQPDHPLAKTIRERELGFLPLWMRRTHLADLCRRSLRGRAECADRFVAIDDGDKTLLRAQPRGLVAHWVAGNVPVLGMLSLLQSFLCKNANLLKVSKTSTGILPHLLDGFSGVTYTNPDGVTVHGQLLRDAVAVVYFDRNDDEAARTLSTLADVRVAWGGREAVEAIMNLPRRFGTEDIVFGPKTSFALVSTERLADEETAKQVAAAVAQDASAFDQQGCNSPHTVFIEKGAAVSPARFAKLLADAMETVARRSPIGLVQPAQMMEVLGVRTEYDMRAEAYYSSGAGWTVVYADEDRGLADPCYLRTLFVRPVDDAFDVVPYCSVNTQTVGLAIDGRRLELADALTAAGVERCPDVGKMRLYEAPWDGLFPMERLVRWVTT